MNKEAYFRKLHAIAVLGSDDEKQNAREKVRALADESGEGGEDDVIRELEAENKVLRARLNEAARFALDLCEHEDCAGDYTVGLAACPMWCAGDVDDNGNEIEAHCELEKWLAEERKDD